jgi:hypothetical protein
MSYTNIDNVLGYPIPQWVMNQVLLRSEMNSIDNRDNTNLVQIANKSGWVRLVSSVNVGKKSPTSFVTAIIPELFAKQFVLFGGTSAYSGITNVNVDDFSNNVPSYKLRSGIGLNGSYGMLGQNEIREYGFRPFPGIKSVRVQTQGKLGSIRAADIQFSVNDKAQLDIVDLLYFKLGYTMFLEWGNTFFYKEDKTSADEIKPQSTLYKGEDYSIDPFEKGLDKDLLRYKIAKSVRNSDGNYDAMLGIVTNFSFTSNTDGGYDCSLKLMSLGVLGESVRVNNVNSLTKVFSAAVQKLINNANAVIRRNYENAIAAQIQSASQNASTIGMWPQCFKTLVDAGTAKIRRLFDGTHVIEYQDVRNKILYYFYYNGRYVDANNQQKVGDWKCVGNILYIDGNRLILNDQFTYSQAVNRDNINKVKRYTSGWIKNSSQFEQFNYIYAEGNTVFIAFEKFQKIISPRDDTFKAKLDFDQIGINSENLWSVPPRLRFEDPREVVSDNNKLTRGSGVNAFLMSSFSENTYNNINYNSITRYEVEATNKILERAYFYDSKYKLNNEYIEFTINVSYELEDESLKTVNYVDDIEKRLNDIISNKDTPFEVKITRFSNLREGVDKLKYQIDGTFPINVTETITRSSPTGGTLTKTQTKPKTVTYRIEFDDSDIFKDIQIEPGSNSLTGNLIDATAAAEQQPQTQETQEEEGPTLLQSSEIQNKEAAQYKSQLEIILRAIQLNSFATVENITGVTKIPWLKSDNNKTNKTFVKDLFINGAFTKDFDYLTSPKVLTTQEIEDYYTKQNSDHRFKIQALFGFHKALMYENYDEGLKNSFLEKLKEEKYQVDFEQLFTSYIIPYRQSQSLIEGVDIHYPCYIPLSWFFFILNHCCLLYDTSKKDSNVPLFYLDFNPKSNVCQTSPSSLTTDPLKFVIPFNGNLSDYKAIFDKLLVNNEYVLGDESDPENKLPQQKLWNEDSISQSIPKTIDGEDKNGYRSKFLNTLVSIDYLLSSIKSFSFKDETDSVYFKALIENVLADLSRYTGLNNAFRLSYCDEANCFAVVDDQFVPGVAMANTVDALTENAHKKYKRLGLSTQCELPLFGKKSVARDFRISTDISTKLASMLAISANADVGNRTTAATDATTFGKPNIGLEDRYKTVITANQDNELNKKANDRNVVRSEREAAQQFNNAISMFYKGAPIGGTTGDAITENYTSHATSYYVERVAKLRGEDSGSESTMVLPLSIDFSTDGISGLSMMQGFTVNDQLLPYSYTSTNLSRLKGKDRRVGFVVTGLNHTIENNTWTTEVKGNMYFIKSKEDFNRQAGKQAQGNFVIPLLQTFNQSSANTEYTTDNKQSSQEAKTAAEKYLRRAITDKEWNELVSAVFAEASRNTTEEAWVMAVILNRTRTKFNKANTITDVLTQKFQFQSVTGDKKNGYRPKENYIKGPSSRQANSIYNATKILETIPENYLYFTSNVVAAYKDVPNGLNFRDSLLKKGGKIIGDTIFSTTA